MEMNDDLIFQQDDASSHRAKTTKRGLKDQHINRLEWTGNSPDMLPIENVWDILKTGVGKRKPSTKDALMEVL